MSKILLLEDDLSLINGLSFVFKKKQGFELSIARTLKEAEGMWKDGKYDLLILDVSLPDGCGFEFCKKKVRLTSKVPIIFLTASDEETSIIMGLDIGGDDYITKTVQTGSFVSGLMRLTSSRKFFSGNGYGIAVEWYQSSFAARTGF